MTFFQYNNLQQIRQMIPIRVSEQSIDNINTPFITQEHIPEPTNVQIQSDESDINTKLKEKDNKIKELTETLRITEMARVHMFAGIQWLRNEVAELQSSISIMRNQNAELHNSLAETNQTNRTILAKLIALRRYTTHSQSVDNVSEHIRIMDITSSHSMPSLPTNVNMFSLKPTAKEFILKK